MADHIDDIDINHIITKPLYFGMFVNVMVPVILLFVCYWINKNYSLTSRVTDADQNILLIVFNVLAVAQAGFAWHWRSRLYGRPMVRRKETAVSDIAEAYAKRSKPLFLLIASISIWGYLWFFLTGRFETGVWFILFSFIVFQLVRPRHGFIQKLVEKQVAMAERGETAPGGLV